jgi:hypothetical protein
MAQVKSPRQGQSSSYAGISESSCKRRVVSSAKKSNVSMDKYTGQLLTASGNKSLSIGMRAKALRPECAPEKRYNDDLKNHQLKIEQYQDISKLDLDGIKKATKEMQAITAHISNIIRTTHFHDPIMKAEWDYTATVAQNMLKLCRQQLKEFGGYRAVFADYRQSIDKYKQESKKSDMRYKREAAKVTQGIVLSLNGIEESSSARLPLVVKNELNKLREDARLVFKVCRDDILKTYLA